MTGERASMEDDRGKNTTDRMADERDCMERDNMTDRKETAC